MQAICEPALRSVRRSLVIRQWNGNGIVKPYVSSDRRTMIQIQRIVSKRGKCTERFVVELARRFFRFELKNIAIPYELR